MTALGLFDCVRNKSYSNAKRIVGIAVAGCFVPFVIFGVSGLRINTTVSLPLGLYKVTSDERAPLVEFCPAEPYASLAIRRGYRPTGNCPDGAAPLLKPVVARAGETVEFTERGISVKGALLPNTAPQATDTQGLRMSHWDFGTFRVEPGTVWVASSYNARSFDSRYFGPIKIRRVTFHVHEFLVLGSDAYPIAGGR